MSVCSQILARRKAEICSIREKPWPVRVKKCRFTAPPPRGSPPPRQNRLLRDGGALRRGAGALRRGKGVRHREGGIDCAAAESSSATAERSGVTAAGCAGTEKRGDVEAAVSAAWRVTAIGNAAQASDTNASTTAAAGCAGTEKRGFENAATCFSARRESRAAAAHPRAWQSGRREPRAFSFSP